MQKQHFPLVLLFLSLVWVSCKKDKNQLHIPSNYDATNYAANTTDETTLRTALSNLSNEMKKGRSSGSEVDVTVLNQLFQAGTPSLELSTTDYYKNRISGNSGWLAELAKASGNNYTPGAPLGEGGVFGSYLFDENGLDLEQVIEKGLFGAAFYNHAVTLMQGALSPATADKLVCMFGAHPDFPNTDNAANTANPDRFMAQYAARRDKNDGNGLYSQMKNALLKLQAATKAGDDYRSEQLEAVEAIQQTWEKVNFATVINYCHTVISILSSTNPTDAQLADAMHAYGEVVGFVHGWRTLPDASRIISDTEIDEMLVLLNVPYDGTPASYQFVSDPVNELPKLTQVIEKLKAVYDFSSQEIEDFKENWVAKQGR